MKNVIIVELFSEDFRQICSIYRGIYKLYGAEEMFDTLIGVPPPSSWVAEILGPDEKYQFKRNFLRRKINYRHSNSKGSRNVFAEFIIESGHYYEVKAQVSWGRANRYFCTLSESGEIIELTEEEICKLVGAETKEQRKERRDAEKLLRHKRT